MRHWNRRSSDFPRAHGSGSEKGGGGGSLCRSINAIFADAGMHVIYLRTFGAAGRRFLDFVGSAYRPLFRMGELAFCRPTHPQAPFLLTMNGHFLFDETKRKWGFNLVRHSRTSPHQSGAFDVSKRKWGAFRLAKPAFLRQIINLSFQIKGELPWQLI